jgi:hypothetical protein
MEDCIGEPIPPIVELEEALRDGVALAKLTRTFAPELVPRIFEHPKLQFRHSDNIDRFFRFLRKVELPDVATNAPWRDITDGCRYFSSRLPTCTTKRIFLK